jgi:Carboxypeptidase regulatory-like domain
VAVWFLGILLLAAATSGQNPLPSGNLYGTALDPEGKSVPGVTVTLRGPGAPQSASTDLPGDFRFLYLSPGKYSLTLERTGFAPVHRDVDVTLGGNAVLTVTLAVAGAEETVTVSGGSPALDSRETETGATFERKELDTIPTTRDPWAILRQVPGVLIANMNVNGADTGTQTVFVGKGSHKDQNTYNLDGVAIPPAPSRATTSYAPNREPGEIVIATSPDRTSTGHRSPVTRYRSDGKYK